MLGFFPTCASRVLDEYDERIEVISWTSDQEKRQRHIHTSKVREVTSNEV